MDLEYASDDLREVCTRERAANKRYDAVLARGLRNRIKQMESADNVQDLLDGLGKWHWLGQEFDGCLGGSLNRNWRIVVRPQSATAKDAQARGVRVLAIVDYH